MSGRIRSIKPELLEDAVTAGLSHMAFRLFIGCILLADDYGNLRFEAPWLKGQVFWAHEAELDLNAFVSAIEELTVAREGSSEPLVSAYIVKGQRYGAIRGWAKHQKVQHAGKPRVPGPELAAGGSPIAPAPPSSSAITVSGDPHESLTPDHRSPITDHRSPTPITECEPARAHTREVASLGPEPQTLPATVDVPIPPGWLERAEAILRRTCITLDLAASWNRYRCQYADPTRSLTLPLTLPRWLGWVETDVGKAAEVQARRDNASWGGLRLAAGGRGAGSTSKFAPLPTPPAPFHLEDGDPGGGLDDDIDPTYDRATAVEVAARLAAGDWPKPAPKAKVAR